MRLCRVAHDGQVTAGFYDESGVLPLPAVANASGLSIGGDTDNLLSLLPNGERHEQCRKLYAWVSANVSACEDLRISADNVQLRVPVPRPAKLFLLAGNYAKHIEEGGEQAAERAETFPYVFMKPPSTTLTHPADPVVIPSASPDAIDWELELAVVIGKGGKAIAEADALSHVAGYTVINDISNRRYRPNPERKERPKDAFFDWLHGKWHDSFCPCGPCIASSEAIDDPQSLAMELRVNGAVKQSASTAQQIFPVAAVIEFISQMVTLEPGDLISTGTAAGVGNTTGDYLKAGDAIEAEIEGIGVLRSPVVAEAQ